MLSPKSMKYRKPYHRHFKRDSCCGTEILFGDYRFQSLEVSWINSQQIESSRRTLSRYIRRVGKIWIRVFPDKVITRRPTETRMGTGKGRLKYYTTEMYPRTIIFEIYRISKIMVIQAIRVIVSKLPVKIQIIMKYFI